MVDEHLDLIAAIRDGNRRQARHLMREHLREAAQKLTANLTLTTQHSTDND